MEKVKISKTWRKINLELDSIFQKMNLSFNDFKTWIIESIQNIQRKEFIYYITVGRSIENQDQLIDIILYLNKKIFNFTIFEHDKNFGIYPIKNVIAFHESIDKKIINRTFVFQSDLKVYVEDKIENSKQVKEFTNKILALMWDDL